MPVFQYIAREPSGNQVRGEMVATTKQELLQVLAARQLFPLNVTGKAQGWRRSRVSSRVTARFFAQLSDLLNAGVPLIKSLEITARQFSSQAAFRDVLDAIRLDLSGGKRFADALRQHPATFSEVIVNLVSAAEEGGFLEDTLQRISNFMERDADIRRRIWGAISYPLFVFVVGIAVVVTMLTFFVPRFSQIFASIAERGELPWATQTLLSLSALFSNYGLWLIAILAIIVVVSFRLFRSGRGRIWFDRRLMLLEFGNVYRQFAIARFCRTLGTLLSNGVPAIESLRIAKDATGNRALSLAVEEATAEIMQGGPLQRPLSATGMFPDDVLEIIAVGQESSTLDVALVKIADSAERKSTQDLELFVRLVEPVMLLLVAGFVMFIVVALLMPIFQSTSAIGAS